MQRPAFISGITYIQFLTVISMISTFDGPYAGRIPLYIGSLLSIHAQWRYYAFLLLFVAFATVGLALGRNWSRWIILVTEIAGWMISAPIRSTQGIISFLVYLVLGATFLGMLFGLPAARVYFARSRQERPSFSLRGLFVIVLHTACAWITYRVLLSRFTNGVSFTTTVLTLAAFSLPALLLGMVVRWNITTACRDGATVLIATSLFLGIMFLGSAISVHSSNPGLLSMFDWKDAPAITAATAIVGATLAGAFVYRTRRAQFSESN